MTWFVMGVVCKVIFMPNPTTDEVEVVFAVLSWSFDNIETKTVAKTKTSMEIKMTSWGLASLSLYYSLYEIPNSRTLLNAYKKKHEW